MHPSADHVGLGSSAGAGGATGFAASTGADFAAGVAAGTGLGAGPVTEGLIWRPLLPERRQVPA